jgi:hypothetical protein
MSGVSTPPSGEKPTGGVPEHVEHIATHDRVPGHENYYEKDGLRTYGDGEDHDHEPQMSFRRLMSLVAMAFIWTGSQIPVYIFGGIPPYIYADLGGVDRCVYPSRLQRIALTLLQMDLVRACKLTCPRWNLSIRWLALRSSGPSICGIIRLFLSYAWNDCLFNCSYNEHLHWCVYPRVSARTYLIS